MDNFHKKFILIIALFLLFGSTVNAQLHQLLRQSFLSITPYYGHSYSQLDLVSSGVEVGFGFYNRNSAYIQGVFGINSGNSLKDDYDRATKFTGIVPGVKAKYKLLGNSEYLSAAYFDNMRLTVDAAFYLHLYSTEAKIGEIVVVDELNVFPSLHWGVSVLIPYSFTAKFTKRFFNRSDLFVELLYKTYLSQDISRFYSSNSNIKNVTQGYRIGLNYIYYIR